MKRSISQYSRRRFPQNICKICRWFKVCSATVRKHAKNLSYFGVNISENLIASSNFFLPKSPLKFWESCRQSQCHTNYLLFCWKIIEYFAKTENRIASVILCQQSRYWKSCWRVFIRKSSFEVLFPTHFYTRQREWIILNLVKKVN